MCIGQKHNGEEKEVIKVSLKLCAEGKGQSRWLITLSSEQMRYLC